MCTSTETKFSFDPDLLRWCQVAWHQSAVSQSRLTQTDAKWQDFTPEGVPHQLGHFHTFRPILVTRLTQLDSSVHDNHTLRAAHKHNTCMSSSLTSYLSPSLAHVFQTILGTWWRTHRPKPVVLLLGSGKLLFSNFFVYFIVFVCILWCTNLLISLTGTCVFVYVLIYFVFLADFCVSLYMY